MENAHYEKMMMRLINELKALIKIRQTHLTGSDLTGVALLQICRPSQLYLSVSLGAAYVGLKVERWTSFAN